MGLGRRDFSKYLVHLTRDLPTGQARNNLLSILSSLTIEARSPLGIAIKRLEHHGCATDEALASQRVCCFSETPLEDLGGLIDPGVWRQNDFRPYGLVFERETLLLEGANPVWYLNSYSAPGVNFPWLAHRVNDLIAEAVDIAGGDADAMAEAFCRSPIAKLAPMIETMGVWRTGEGWRKKKDFSFEREWRLGGDYGFAPDDVVAIITPPEDEDTFREDLYERVPDSFFDGALWRNLEAEEVVGE